MSPSHFEKMKFLLLASSLVVLSAAQTAAGNGNFEEAAATFPGLGLPSPATVAAYAANSTCCLTLQHYLGNITLLQGSYLYNYSETTWPYFTAQERELQPTCIIHPITGSTDTAVAVALLSFLGSYDDSCKFAVKGGGHNTNPGFANIEAGVTIDLKALDHVDISDGKVAKVGGGCTWDQLYGVLDNAGLMVVGGRVNGVGVGGVTLAGGISFFGPQRGWAADNVVNYELVLAYGAVINVNASSYPDLFHVLKGGNNNFGIVTRFDLAMFENGLGYGGNLAYPISTMAANLGVFSNLSVPYYDPLSSFSTGVSFANGGWVVANSVYYTQDDTTQWSGFQDVKPQLANTVRTLNVSALATEKAGKVATTNRAIQYTGTILNTDLYENLIDITTSFITRVNATAKNVTNLQASLFWEPIPASMSAASAGQDLMGLNASSPGMTLWLSSFAWTNPKDDANVTAAAANLALVAGIIASEEGSVTNTTFVYSAYANAKQKPYQGWAGGAVEKLQAASKKYDPNGVFQKLVPGGFKVPT